MSSVRTAAKVASGLAGGGVIARAVRTTAVALLSVVLLTAGVTATATPVAAADEPLRQGGATATLEGLRTYGEAVVREDGEELRTGAGLFEMSVDGGGTLQTYGIDVDKPTQQHARYGETDWDQTSLHDNPDAGKIHWIVRHSYPQVNDLLALAKASRAGKLTPRSAAAGTQVAIWRFTDGFGTEGDAEVTAADPAAEKLADHLEREARAISEPKASISLSRAEVSGGTGERLGPVTVRTGATGVAVSTASGSGTEGVRVVGRDGKPVTEMRDGGQFYFEIPDKFRKAGTSSLTVQAATKISVGRAFTGVGGHARSQAQILAGSSRSTVSAATTVHWTRNGSVPAVTAEKNCARAGVDVTVVNSADTAYGFRIAGRQHGVAAGSSRTVTVPVAEDQAYRIRVAGPGGLKKTVTGGLDCETTSATAAGEAEGITPQSHAATAGAGSDDGAGESGSGDLAATGADSSTQLVLGLAIGLVVLGAAAVLSVRRRRPGGSVEQ